MTFALTFIIVKDKSSANTICDFSKVTIVKWLQFIRLLIVELELPGLLLGIGLGYIKSTQDILSGISKLDHLVKISVF